MPDSKLLDMQQAFELSFSMLSRILSNNKCLVMHGLDQTHAINNELLLLMDDIILSGKRMLEGIEVNDETLALEPLKEVAAKMEGSRRNGHFLNHLHTLKWFSKEQVPRKDNIMTNTEEKNGLRWAQNHFVQRANEKIATYSRHMSLSRCQKKSKQAIEKDT